MTAAERSDWILAQARALGFDLCGIAPAADFDELARLPDWLGRGYAGEMRYLHDPRRRSPQAALPGARSIIVCALNYNTPLPYSTDACAAPPTALPKADAEAPGPQHHSSTHSIAPHPSPRGWISRYAWGDDYHDVLGAKLDALLAAMRRQFAAAAPFDARAYVDTGPVHERVAAYHAGLGWLGKNTCLINEQLGSWLFLGVILTTLELPPSASSATGADNQALTQCDEEAGVQKSGVRHPTSDLRPLCSRRSSSPHHSSLVTGHLAADLCGQCTQCLDACPTGALVEPYLLDARRCISYLTIELRGPIPEEFHDALGWHVFGCDICQDVCPFNRRAPVSSDPRFLPRSVGALLAAPEFQPRPLDAPSAAKSLSLFAPPLDTLASLSESDFCTLFRGSAIKRTKRSGLTRNAHIAL